MSLWPIRKRSNVTETITDVVLAGNVEARAAKVPRLEYLLCGSFDKLRTIVLLAEVGKENHFESGPRDLVE